MAYVFQNFIGSTGSILTEAQLNQIEVNIKDHIHGRNSVVAEADTFLINADSAGYGLKVKGRSTGSQEGFIHFYRNDGTTLEGAIRGDSSVGLSFRGPSDTNDLVINSSGNVGIGTTSPGAKLEISDTIARSIIVNTTNGSGGYIDLQKSGGQRVLLGHGTTMFAGGGAGIRTGSGIPFAIGVGGATERLVIDNSGNVGIGTTSPGTLLTLPVTETGTNTALTMGFGNRYGIGFNGDGSGHFNIFAHQTAIAIGIGFDTGSYGTWAEKVTITSAGNVGIGLSPSYQFQLSADSAAKPSTNTWTIASDERLKQDIVLADLQRCYDIVKTLPLKRYTWKDTIYTTEQVADRSKLGWIAQDVQTVFPKSTEVHKFTGVETVELDNKGKEVLETYEVQEELVETIEEVVEEIVMVGKKPTQKVKTVTKEVKTPLFNEIPVVDEQGNTVMEQYEVTPAQDIPPVLDANGNELKAGYTIDAVMGERAVTYKVPKMITKTRPKKISPEIIDCLSLNSDQIYATMYGAIQMLMAKVEALEAKIP